MQSATTTESQPQPIEVRHVGANAPFRWLAAGLRDLIAMPFASLAYGVVFALVGYALVTMTTSRPHLLSAAVSGFFLAGPFLGMGLYRLSQCREAGEPATFRDSATIWRSNPWSIGLFGVLLAFVLLSWERISAIVFALFHGASLPVTDGGWTDVLIAAADPAFVAVYLTIGAALAAGVFAISAIALPMLITGPVDPVTAAITSVKATLANPGVMLLWAALIVVLITVGMMTAFLGLIIAMPLVAHASWHAYRDLTLAH
ncbi:DUF2189 domain-containing protein [Spiribacter onubensis]|uniref:DUF2189 domain-containing protein n=1 Tax=Spiribacter onubensis TaxID=3122420 RepID=A0ABV3S8B2_9GAMM